jgi:hypothetical protein
VTLHYFREQQLSEAGAGLVRFDVDSLRQVVLSHRGSEPSFWLADPYSYERDGRLLRDSPSPRLLAYSPADRILYATDGCNSCSRRLNRDLETLTDSELQAFAEDNDLRVDLLQHLTNLF